jgi:DNA-binding HxlR family transcriptional regulator
MAESRNLRAPPAEVSPFKDDRSGPHAGDACPIEQALDVIGGKWKIVIVWWLGQGELRFNELRRRLAGITQKMLTQQLRQMEADGLVRRELFPQVPPKVVYSLTPLGHSLRPVLDSLCEWSRRQRLTPKQTKPRQTKPRRRSNAPEPSVRSEK